MAQRKEDELKRMEEAREKAQRRQEKLKQNVLRDAQLYKELKAKREEERKA